MDVQDQSPQPDQGPPQQQPQQQPPAKGGIGVSIFLGIVILLILAAGYAGINTYLKKSSEASALKEDGVETDAEVSSVTEVSGRRIETYHRINVIWDPEGPEITAFAEVLDCGGNRWESGIDVMRIVYLPDDPEVVRLAACADDFDANVFPGIIGIVFLLLGLFLGWKFIGSLRRK